MNTELEVAYRAYIARAKADAARMTAYDCPACEHEIETLVPDVGDVYDTMCVCPFCGKMHFKVVHDDAKVELTSISCVDRGGSVQ